MNAPPPQGDGPLYHFFSGKGGVGKTTLAAATAVHLSRQGLRVLVTSTDPAHSLSDVFGVHIGHRGAALAPNLQGLEIDSTARWAEATVAPSASGEAAPRQRGRLERALTEAMQLVGEAPGVDEFISLELLLETMSARQFDTVVFDTAPTGHTLRLLALPEMLDGWLGRILTVRHQLSRLSRSLRRLMPGAGQETAAADLGAGITDVRERVARARALLTDPDRTLFALVTIPEAMSVLETTRTMAQLAEHSIPLGVVIANQVQPDSETCDHCRLRHAIHQQELVRLMAACGETPVRVMSAKPRVIQGLEALAALGAELWADAPTPR